MKTGVNKRIRKYGGDYKMDVRIKLFIQEKKKALRKMYYHLMKPLVNYLSRKDDERYIKTKESITEDQAIKWISNAIINNTIRYPKEPFRLMIAEWKDDEYHSNSYCIGTYKFRQLLNKTKYRTALDKYNSGIEFQEKVVRHLKSKSGITVTEEVEKFVHTKPKDYKKTYIIQVER